MQNPLTNSLAETAKRRIKAVGLPPNPESEQRKFGHHGDFQSSPKKQQEGGDVALKDMLEVPDQFSLQSPLPPLDSDEQLPRYLGEVKAFNAANDCYQL